MYSFCKLHKPTYYFYSCGPFQTVGQDKVHYFDDYKITHNQKNQCYEGKNYVYIYFIASPEYTLRQDFAMKMHYPILMQNW